MAEAAEATGTGAMGEGGALRACVCVCVCVFILFVRGTVNFFACSRGKGGGLRLFLFQRISPRITQLL
jgi:hypothetical protein